MDLPRKRLYSATLNDTRTAPGNPFQPIFKETTGMADALTTNIVKTLQVLEPSQRIVLLDELIGKLQWLKKHADNGKNEEKAASIQAMIEQTLVEQQHSQLRKMHELMAATQRAGPSMPQPTLTLPVQKVKDEVEILPPEAVQIRLKMEQDKVLGYVSQATNGNMTQEVLLDYLKYPILLIKENGQVRQIANPFYPFAPMISMTPLVQSPPLTKKMASPRGASPKKDEIPPMLVPQVKIPLKKPTMLTTPTPTSSIFKVPLERKAYEVSNEPKIRACNAWSVYTMALPLR